jgi:hypothetical protein
LSTKEVAVAVKSASRAQEVEEVGIGGPVTGKTSGGPAGGLLLEVLFDELPAGQRRLAQLFPYVDASAQLHIQLLGAFNGLALGNVAEGFVDFLAVVEPPIPVAPVSAVEAPRPGIIAKIIWNGLGHAGLLGEILGNFFRELAGKPRKMREQKLPVL